MLRPPPKNPHPNPLPQAGEGAPGSIHHRQPPKCRPSRPSPATTSPLSRPRERAGVRAALKRSHPASAPPAAQEPSPQPSPASGRGSAWVYSSPPTAKMPSKPTLSRNDKPPVPPAGEGWGEGGPQAIPSRECSARRPRTLTPTLSRKRERERVDLSRTAKAPPRASPATFSLSRLRERAGVRAASTALAISPLFGLGLNRARRSPHPTPDPAPGRNGSAPPPRSYRRRLPRLP
jgi:hypothetical protein